MASCRVCRNPTTLTCARCKITYYCGKAHQIMDWKDHKEFCDDMCDYSLPPKYKSTYPGSALERALESAPEDTEPKFIRSPRPGAVHDTDGLVVSEDMSNTKLGLWFQDYLEKQTEKREPQFIHMTQSQLESTGIPKYTKILVVGKNEDVPKGQIKKIDRGDFFDRIECNDRQDVVYMFHKSQVNDGKSCYLSETCRVPGRGVGCDVIDCDEPMEKTDLLKD